MYSKQFQNPCNAHCTWNSQPCHSNSDAYPIVFVNELLSTKSKYFHMVIKHDETCEQREHFSHFSKVLIFGFTSNKCVNQNMQVDTYLIRKNALVLIIIQKHYYRIYQVVSRTSFSTDFIQRENGSILPMLTSEHSKIHTRVHVYKNAHNRKVA